MGSSEWVIVPDDDPLRTYTPDEQRLLTENLLRLTQAIHAGRFSHLRADQRLLEVFHANIFSGVRSHAGRIRAYGRGSERVTFGPHRSAHRDEVEAQLGAVFRRATLELRRLQAEPLSPTYEEEALRCAVLLHADIIRIHPFEDGNGRSTRALMNAVLVRLGLLPVPIDAPKQEYVDALNHYFTQQDETVLLDLILRLYPSGSAADE